LHFQYEHVDSTHHTTDFVVLECRNESGSSELHISTLSPAVKVMYAFPCAWTRNGSGVDTLVTVSKALLYMADLGWYCFGFDISCSLEVSLGESDWPGSDDRFADKVMRLSGEAKVVKL
jgi:hypothetical protein